MIIKSTCLNCGKDVEGELKKDELGLHIICPECGSSFDTCDEEHDNIIDCSLDPSVPQNSQCAKCCLYCIEKEECEYLCEGIRLGWDEKKIARECTFAYVY